MELGVTHHVVRASPGTRAGSDHDGVDLTKPFRTGLPPTQSPISDNEGDTEREANQHPIVAGTLAEQTVGRYRAPEDGSGVLCMSVTWEDRACFKQTQDTMWMSSG